MNVGNSNTARPTLWGSLKDAAKGFAPVKDAAKELFSQTAAEVNDTFHGSDKPLSEKLKIAAGQVVDTAKEQVGVTSQPQTPTAFSMARTRIQDINAGTRADVTQTFQNKDLSLGEKLSQASHKLFQNAVNTTSVAVGSVVQQTHPQETPAPAPVTLESFRTAQMKAIAAPPAALPEQVWNIR